MEVAKLLNLLLVLDAVFMSWTVSGESDTTPSSHKSWHTDENRYDNTIRVDPTMKTSSNSTECITQEIGKGSSTQLVCPDISSALHYHQSSTAFILASGENIVHYFIPDSNSTFFQGLSDIAFLSNSSTESASIECRPGAGLGFSNIKRIILKNLEFSYCGALRTSTSKNFSTEDFTFEQFRISLFFYNCTNVSMQNVAVQNSVNALGVGMYDTDGMVVISRSGFINNTVAGDIALPGGGGFVVEFSYCVPGDVTCSIQTTHNSGSSYIFSNCKFISNVARPFGTTRLLPFNETYEGLGRGGGLGLFFKSNAKNNVIQIIDCHFEKNTAQWGGGMYIGFEDTSISNEIILENAFFYENACFFASTYGTGGGAVKIVSLLNFLPSSNFPASGKSITGNSVTVEGIFISNKALGGGAISFTPGRQLGSLLQQTTKLNVLHSIFYGNVARLGAAIQVELFPLFSNGSLSPVLIENCSFYDNSIDYLGSDISNYAIGIGTFYTYEIPLVFKSIILFSNNGGSALALVGAYADFSDSNSSFIRNSGSFGGGIALLGSSHFLVNDNTHMHFESNTAVDGAAIYNHVISRGVLKSSIVCFVRHIDPFITPKEWKSTFTFINNSKRSIFSTSVYPCTVNNRKTSLELSKNLLFCVTSQWKFINSTCTSEIETQGNEYLLTNSSLIQVFPGRGFLLPIKVLDDLDHDITKATGYESFVQISSEMNSSRNGAVDPKYFLTSGNYLIITGQEETNVSLEVESTGSRPHLVRLDVSLQKCPPGFLFRSNTNSEGVKLNYLGKCTCHLMHSYRGNLNCSDQDFKAQIPWNYWIGPDPTGLREGQLVMGELPNLYAEQVDFDDNIITLPQSFDELDAAICGIRNRTGPICGKCKDGFSTAVNSYTYICTPCNNETSLVKNILLYLTFAYVPYVVLFTGIIFFRLKLTSSAVTGFITFAQLTSSNDLFDVSAHVHTSTAAMQNAYKFVYGIFNLNSFANLMHPFCIAESFTTLDVLCLEYTLALLPLLIIVIVSAFLRLREIRCICCRRTNFSINMNLPRLRRRCKKNKTNSADERPLLHAFVAFLLLSYTKVSLVSMKILASLTLFDKSGKRLDQLRIYLAGYFSFSSKEFILPYGLISVLVMIFFVMIPTLFLLGLPQLIDRLLDKQCFRCLRRVWPTLKINAILDAFQGYYKPNMRFFSGLYLVFRLSIIISYASTNNYLHQYLLQQVFVTLMLTLIAIFRPYKREIFNYVDIMIFLDLAIVNSISAYFYSSSLTLNGMEREPPLSIYIIQYILLWLPLFYMMCYIMYKFLIRIGFSKYVVRRIKEYRNVNRRPEGLSASTGNTLEESSSSDEDADSALFKRALDVNHFRSPSGRVPTTLVSVLTGEESGVHEDTVSSGFGTGTA